LCYANTALYFFILNKMNGNALMEVDFLNMKIF